MLPLKTAFETETPTTDVYQLLQRGFAEGAGSISELSHVEVYWDPQSTILRLTG